MCFHQGLSRVQLFVTPQTAALQASLSITNSQSLLKLMSIKSAMPSNYLILCHPLFLLPSIFPSIRVFSNESTLRMRWPKYWSFSFSISPSSEYSGLISFRMCFSLQYQRECLSHIMVPNWSLPSKNFDIHLLLATKAAVSLLEAFTNTSFRSLWEKPWSNHTWCSLLHNPAKLTVQVLIDGHFRGHLGNLRISLYFVAAKGLGFHSHIEAV